MPVKRKLTESKDKKCESKKANKKQGQDQDTVSVLKESHSNDIKTMVVTSRGSKVMTLNTTTHSEINPTYTECWNRTLPVLLECILNVPYKVDKIPNVLLAIVVEYAVATEPPKPELMVYAIDQTCRYTGKSSIQSICATNRSACIEVICDILQQVYDNGTQDLYVKVYQPIADAEGKDPVADIMLNNLENPTESSRDLREKLRSNLNLSESYLQKWAKTLSDVSPYSEYTIEESTVIQ